MINMDLEGVGLCQLRVLLRYSPGKTEENHKNIEPEQPLTWQIYELDTINLIGLRSWYAFVKQLMTEPSKQHNKNQI